MQKNKSVRKFRGNFKERHTFKVGRICVAEKLFVEDSGCKLGEKAR